MNQCKRAKQRVMQILMGRYKEEYAQVWDYARECVVQNPSSRVYAEVVERPLPDCEPRFNRFYVCFDACKRGFLAGCRRVVGLDGCFLKGLCKGELLAAVGRDANNQMFPIAWAVVKIENKDTWSWFLKNLMVDLDINDGGGWAFMSDQQKGLVPALAELMPYAEHRMCARHIYANWAKNYKGDMLQKQFWQIAKSTNMADFRLAKQGLLQLTKEGFDALFQTEAKHWCRAFFSEEFKCDIIDNNLSEAFNGRILEARCKPIISMLDDIRVMVITRLHMQRDEATKWSRECGPRIVKKLDANVTASRFCHPVWNGENGYEIIHNNDKYVVNLDRRKCSCRAWELSGIPCPHAICAILMKQERPEDYLHD
ncbi:uncharacterized protein LOC130134769 [Syzygium oleosum]|uniref:uncharacterized protein LOC130134769 n=1 Tax=Syzygium oleosum TaxID=219896 RepID=UPI0024BA8110|nr:uncharacterized protein LOC130134769 [Syzygium oleosum]